MGLYFGEAIFALRFRYLKPNTKAADLHKICSLPSIELTLKDLTRYGFALNLPLVPHLAYLHQEMVDGLFLAADMALKEKYEEVVKSFEISCTFRDCSSSLERTPGTWGDWKYENIIRDDLSFIAEEVKEALLETFWLGRNGLGVLS
jgi:hypothetical protein